MNDLPKTKEELIQKFPDKAQMITDAFSKIGAVGCSDCNKRGQLMNLYANLGLIDRSLIPGMFDPMAVKVQGMPSAGSPRPPCEDCFKEHIAKAVINLNESVIGDGHPEFRWLAIGNLAEASAEILGLNKDLASEIRQIKLRMVREKDFIPDLMTYL
jgi:hypothetical protein